MTTTQKFISAGVVVLIILAALIAFLLGARQVTSTTGSQTLGSTVDPNPEWFTAGFKYGKSNALFESNSVIIPNGKDQAVWKNTTGQAVYVDIEHLALSATSSTAVSSSTFAISVGATSTPTIPEAYSLTWLTPLKTFLGIDEYTVATGTSVADLLGGNTTVIVTDNYVFHASSSPAVMEVPKNWYLFAKVDTICVTEGGCETATSTNRGFTTVTVPFWYHYSSPN